MSLDRTGEMGVEETENQASALESPTVTYVEKPKSFTSWWSISEVQGVICALSIWTCYLYYGFLHEKMYVCEKFLPSLMFRELRITKNTVV